ncbi:MAG: hypothetical protein E2O95_01545 [Acidobacteria bacterium]|nr:MAG: hypothetical protein E2O95_01545 [Acidobacteriota bacterium]
MVGHLHLETPRQNPRRQLGQNPLRAQQLKALSINLGHKPVHQLIIDHRPYRLTHHLRIRSRHYQCPFSAETSPVQPYRSDTSHKVFNRPYRSHSPQAGAPQLLSGTRIRNPDGSVSYHPDDDHLPVLLVMSDNGPQMSSGSTREFMALSWLATHYGRPGTPTDQAWIESFFGHLKGEFPHLDLIEDIDVLRAELDIRRTHYNQVRLHAGIGYVTPDQEHRGEGSAVRKGRREGLVRARKRRVDYHRNNHTPES